VFDGPDIAAALHTYVLETAPLMALLLDADDRVVVANDHARRVLGAGAVGRPLAEQIVDFNRTLDVPAVIRQRDTEHRLTLSTASGLPETFCFRFFSVSGGTLALASLDVQEQVELRDQVLALNRDLNNLTRQLHQANAELSELNQLKNQFLGMAAHDLRKPVGVIMTYGGFVLDEAGAQLSGEHREYLQTCLKAATDMKRLIDGFLDLAVIESGHLPGESHLI
jgi:signal transduction histidine kinase